MFKLSNGLFLHYFFDKLVLLFFVFYYFHSYSEKLHFNIFLLLFSHQSNSENATLSSTKNSSECSSEGNCLENDEFDQFMYIQMEFCEKSTLR